ncbi:MAG: PfkB family carbohydrate kinase [Candidatus Dechloromonas phosphoritropha]
MKQQVYNDSMYTPQIDNHEVGAPSSRSRALEILLFGEVLADVYPDRRMPGGAPFSVGCHLAACGIPVALVSRLGVDSLGDFLQMALARSGIDPGFVQRDPEHASGHVDVIATVDGHRFEIVPDQAFDFIDRTTLHNDLSRGQVQPRLIYFGTLAQRNSASRAALDSLLAVCEATRFVDLNLRPPWISADVVEKSLTAANIVKLSEEELCYVGSLLGLPAAMEGEAIARQLAQRFAIDMIVVTCGARGAWCLCGELVQRVAAVPANTIEGDAVGAGDAFSAICILGHLLHWDMPSTLNRAAAFAAAICGIRGPVPESLQFYGRFRERWRLEHN